VSESVQIALTYRGEMGRRSVRIARESHGRIWYLRLTNGLWTLIDHEGNDLGSFTQSELHAHVALPGILPGHGDLSLVGLGAKIHCFQPDAEPVHALFQHVARSEWANASRLARWHCWVGGLFLGLSAICLLAGISMIPGCYFGSLFEWPMAGAFALPPVLASVYYSRAGVRELRTARRYGAMPAMPTDRGGEA
jgi:hypothetical protein